MANATGAVLIAAEGRLGVSPSADPIAPYTRIYCRWSVLSTRTTTVGLEPVPTDAAVEDVVVADDPRERPLRQAVAVVGQLGLGALLLRRGGRAFVALR